jgi:hypothetical protein
MAAGRGRIPAFTRVSAEERPVAGDRSFAGTGVIEDFWADGYGDRDMHGSRWTAQPWKLTWHFRGAAIVKDDRSRSAGGTAGRWWRLVSDTGSVMRSSFGPLRSRQQSVPCGGLGWP